MYEKMPFGIVNAGATLQRTMDIAFVGERDKFVAIYLDFIIVFQIEMKVILSILNKPF